MAKAKPTASGAGATATATPSKTKHAKANLGDAQSGEKGKAVATHLLGILTTFLGPLLLYFLFRNKSSPWLREHLDESLNYWILVTIAFIVLVVLTVVLGTSGAAIFVFLLAFLVVIVALLFGVISIVKASMGKPSHYPLNIKLIK